MGRRHHRVPRAPPDRQPVVHAEPRGKLEKAAGGRQSSFIEGLARPRASRSTNFRRGQGQSASIASASAGTASGARDGRALERRPTRLPGGGPGTIAQHGAGRGEDAAHFQARRQILHGPATSRASRSKPPAHPAALAKPPKAADVLLSRLQDGPFHHQLLSGTCTPSYFGNVVKADGFGPPGATRGSRGLLDPARRSQPSSADRRAVSFRGAGRVTLLATGSTLVQRLDADDRPRSWSRAARPAARKFRPGPVFYPAARIFESRSQGGRTDAACTPEGLAMTGRPGSIQTRGPGVRASCWRWGGPPPTWVAAPGSRAEPVDPDGTDRATPTHIASGETVPAGRAGGLGNAVLFSSIRPGVPGVRLPRPCCTSPDTRR